MVQSAEYEATDKCQSQNLKSLKPFQNVEILLWKHKGAINGFKLEVKEKKNVVDLCSVKELWQQLKTNG